jgi:hypothetical protein
MGKSWLFACLMPLVGLAQSFTELAGGRSRGLAHSTVAIADVWSACHNPGGMALVKGTQMGLSFEQRYFLSDLSLGNMALVHSVEGGALGFSFGISGFESYQRLSTGLAYAHSFGQRISAGVRLSYGKETLPEPAAEGSEMLLTSGCLVEISEKFQIGMSLSHPLKKLHSYPETRIIVRLGGVCHLSEKLLLTSELFKTTQRQESLRSGLEYTAAETLAIRLGVASRPWRHNLGVGFRYEGYSCDLGFEYSYTLGATANISLQYAIL